MDCRWVNRRAWVAAGWITVLGSGMGCNSEGSESPFGSSSIGESDSSDSGVESTTGSGETTSTDGSADATTGDGDGDGDDDGSTTGPGDCGNSIVDGFEACDCGSDGECTFEELGAVDCTGVVDPVSGNNFSGGVLDCNLSCQHITTGCFVCGDGVKTDTETCDGTQLGTNTCGTAGFLGGTIACSSTCELDTSGCTMASWSEDFESGSLDTSTWGSAGDLPWTVDTTASSSGSYAGHAGNIGSNQETELVLDMTWAAAGTIAYAYKVESESCCDQLHFFIDGVEQGSGIGGDVDWTDVSWPVTAGTHRLRWQYEKDGSVDTGQYTAWIDDVRSDGTLAVPTCGDAFLSSGEVCDGAMLGANTCGSEGFLGGTLACTGGCALDTSGCTVATWSEDWESGSVDPATWVSAGDGAWVVDMSDASGGVYSAHSPAIGANEQSELVLDMTWGAAGTIAYAFRTDSESCCDQLHFFIDGVEQGTGQGGTTAWSDVSWPVAAGTHRLRWQYEKDGSVDTGMDRAWIDDLRSDGAVAVPTCGDGLLSSGEACDGSMLGTGTCESEGFLGGTLACSNCIYDTSGCAVASFTEGWESGDFSYASYTFGGDANWQVDMSQAQNGVYAAHSGALTGNQTSELNLSLSFQGAGVIGFGHRESSEACCDRLHFYIDGTEQGSGWGGTTGTWAQETYNVSAGNHTFRWTYEKDGTLNQGDDRVWIDDIVSDGSP